MWKLLKYEFRRARTSLLTVLGVIAVLEMYFLISLGVDHMEHVVIAAVLMMFATYGAAVYIFVRGVASYASELKAKSAYLIFMTPNSGLKIMGSKYLYTFVNGVLLGGVCGALGALDLSLIMTHEGDWQSFLRMMDIFLRVNQGVQTGQIVLAIVFIAKDLGLNFSGVVRTVRESSYSKMFFFDDVNHPEYFWKQFLAGVFTVIAMTGLDQDMMQRTLSSRNAKDSQKNLITSGLLQIPVIFLFLCLGVLLYIFAGQKGISEVGDTLFPAVATGGYLPAIVGVLFVIGLVSCAFAAGGSALTALTTSFTVDIIGTKGKSEEQVTTIRKKVHLLMAFLMGVVIFVFYLLNTKSAIDAVYKLASYTYGPILGMFAFGIFSKRKVNDKWVPLVAVIAPVLCFILQSNSERWFGGYKFSYELLLFNALFTFLGLLIISRKKHRDPAAQ